MSSKKKPEFWKVEEYEEFAQFTKTCDLSSFKAKKLPVLVQKAYFCPTFQNSCFTMPEGPLTLSKTPAWHIAASFWRTRRFFTHSISFI
jgi:hypothetical protein